MTMNRNNPGYIQLTAHELGIEESYYPASRSSGKPESNHGSRNFHDEFSGNGSVRRSRPSNRRNVASRGFGQGMGSGADRGSARRGPGGRSSLGGAPGAGPSRGRVPRGNGSKFPGRGRA